MSVTDRLLGFASQRFPRMSSRVLASAGYTFDLDAYGEISAWMPRTAARQDRAWLPLVAQARAGRPRADIVALQDALREMPHTGAVLEAGCGGGYNSEIIEMTSPELRYTGLDLSPAVIQLCREKYPQRVFEVGSAYDLPYPDDAFDLVIDGVALLHMPEWRRALAEYRRVSRGPVILHGLTLTEGTTIPFMKLAYGQPTFELMLSRAELEEVLAGLGMRVRSSYPNLDYDLEEFLGIPTVSETWVLDPA